jgi:hypothetical protein
MDPDATLKEIRRLLVAFYEHADQIRRLSPDELEANGVQLARNVHKLDDWLSGKGFQPQPWLR